MFSECVCKIVLLAVVLVVIVVALAVLVQALVKSVTITHLTKRAADFLRAWRIAGRCDFSTVVAA